MLWDSVLSPLFRVSRTSKFSVLNECADQKHSECPRQNIIVDLNCKYVQAIAEATIARRPWCTVIEKPNQAEDGVIPLCIADFENIDWDPVLKGKCATSSYLVRKGLSRKAQLSLQLRRYTSKNPTSVLKQAVPHTIILETWSAFEEMKLDFGRGMFATFDSPHLMQAPLRQKLDWCLSDARCEVEDDEDKKDWHWILKPSVTNKGADIVVAKNWNDVLDAVEDVPDIREWVLQRYIEDPLLVDGYKFHLRVYVLCVGALRVFVFDNILMLLAAHRYELHDLADVHKHLTNTARSAEDINFDEKVFVKLLDDLPHYLLKQRPHHYANIDQAKDAVVEIRKSIHAITKDLFSAYENEYSIFCPMSNCYEIYGLDFMVNSSMEVSLLEVNPGPDFKQTGDRLRAIIVQLYEQMASIVIDTNLLQLNTNNSKSNNKTTTAVDKLVEVGVDVSDDQAKRNTASAAAAVTVSDGKKVEVQVEVEVPKTFAQVDGECSAVWKETAPDFTLVYSKEWSVSQMKGGMSLK